MLQERLNNLLVLHVHKDCTDLLDLTSIATEFIGDSERRLRICEILILCILCHSLYS